MKQSLLLLEQVLAGYDAVSQLYSHIPPMCTWRAREYAAYRHYTVPKPVLAAISQNDYENRAYYAHPPIAQQNCSDVPFAVRWPVCGGVPPEW